MAARMLYSHQANQEARPNYLDCEDESEEDNMHATDEFDLRQFDPEIVTLLEVVKSEIKTQKYSDEEGIAKIEELCNSEGQTDEEGLLADPQELLEQGIDNIKIKTKTKSCADCSAKTRVSDATCLRKGQHISISGKHATFYAAPFQKQIKLYSHHAIVKRIESCSGQRVKVVLIHFTTKDHEKPAICETVETFDLKYDEIYILEYKNPKHSPDEIVLRAEKEKEKKYKFTKYSVLSNNCEHFATWCIAGKEASFQVQDAAANLSSALSSLLGQGSKIAGLVLRVIRPLKDIALVSADEVATTVSSAAGSITLGVLGGLYLLYCIVMTAYYIKKYKGQNMCGSCLKLNLLNLWFRFAVFGATSSLTFLLIHFALPFFSSPGGIIVLVLLMLLSAVLMQKVPWITEKFLSPIQLEKKQISALTELKPGDIVNFSYYKFPHYFIISDVEQNPNPPTRGKLKCIHYSLPSIFSKRVVTEEVFNIDLNKMSVKQVDYRKLNTHSSGEVVRRARKRVGERKWNPASNRSDHFCHWAKVNLRQEINNYPSFEEIGESKSTTLSSLLLEIKQVHLMQEIQLGDVVQLKGTEIFRDKGILVGLTDLRDDRKFRMEVIMLKGRVRLVKNTVDLNTDKLFLKQYHPAHCIPLEERAKRALAMVDRKSKRLTQSGFITDCILINP